MTTDIDAEIYNWVRVAKGDVPGHIFHGNQYQQGTGGGSNSRLASRVLARGTRGERGNVTALKSMLQPGKKITLVGANGTHRMLGVPRTISQVRSSDVKIAAPDGTISAMSIPKSSDLTLDKENGVFTLHGHDLMATDETGQPMNGNLTYKIEG